MTLNNNSQRDIAFPCAQDFLLSLQPVPLFFKESLNYCFCMICGWQTLSTWKVQNCGVLQRKIKKKI